MGSAGADLKQSSLTKAYDPKGPPRGQDGTIQEALPRRLLLDAKSITGLALYWEFVAVYSHGRAAISAVISP